VAAAGFLFILLCQTRLTVMVIISRLIFAAVHWASRRGLRDEENFSNEVRSKAERGASEERKQEARRAGVRGETYAYWYLRRHGYVFVARNFTPRGVKGELDLVGYDGEALAFVEVRTRTVQDGISGLPELSVTPDKQHVLTRTAQRFLAERHVGECPCRFDVMAIDNEPGHPPVVRLHKDAFSPQMH
jgi:putative endonuclease